MTDERDRSKRSVKFNSKCETRGVVPYSEVYGVHPRIFDFDASGIKIPCNYKTFVHDERDIGRGISILDNSPSDSGPRRSAEISLHGRRGGSSIAACHRPCV